MEDVHEPSDRSFGFLIAAALLILGIRHRWALGPGVALVLIAVVFPAILRVPKRAWLAFGEALSSAVNPLVLGVLFFGVITPAGFLMRIAGRDPLRLKASPRLSTCWIERSTPSSDMTEEF
jgi:hypothetical protein